MSTTEPIKDLKKIKELKNYYLRAKELRNYCLITVGINTALRISDLLSLKWKDVYDFNNNNFKSHITVIEQKTKKENKLALNKNSIDALKTYKKSLEDFNKEDFVFKSRKGLNKPVTRIQAFRIITEAAESIGLVGNISCHSLRKTFGYWSWKKGISPVMIMNIFNHSSFEITKRYLCIDQDDKDEVFRSVNL